MAFDLGKETVRFMKIREKKRQNRKSQLLNLYVLVTG